jgi:hypothetical protein
MNDRNDVDAASRAFIASAFGMLKSEYVIPRPFYDAYIAVGRDYAGAGIMALLEYKRLEDQLKADYTSRFPEGIGTAAEYREYPSTYIFTLLEACVARSAQAENFDLPNAIVDPILIELRTMLEKSTFDVVCTRHVLHLTTVNAQEINLGDITVLPRKGDKDYRGLQKRIQREIAGAARAWNRDVPVPPFGSPEALLILRRTTNGTDPYKDCEQLSTEIDRFLFLARLLTSGTTHSAYEVSGMPTLIAPMRPVMHKFKGPELPLVRRTVQLTGNEGPAFGALGDLVDAAEVKRTGMATTSFDVAIRKFNNSHAGESMYEQIVDLATALEAVLIGSGDENDAISLRLRTRAAALLATDNDAAVDLYNDVTQLYALRSKLVHGGQIKLSDLRKIVSKVSTVAPQDTTDQRFGIGLSHAVDRLRDIVRRAILARLCLAEQPNPLWPFQDNVSVDAVLSDDSNRGAWRTHWRQRLITLGVESAANPAKEAVDFFQPDSA